jgi:hypothetical protein
MLRCCHCHCHGHWEEDKYGTSGLGFPRTRLVLTGFGPAASGRNANIGMAAEWEVSEREVTGWWLRMKGQGSWFLMMMIMKERGR